MATRRMNGEGTIRKRENGLWEARFTLCDGTRKSIYGKTQKAAKEAMILEKEKAELRVLSEKKGPTVGQWMDEWLRDYVKTKPLTRVRYETDIRLHIKPNLGDICLAELKPYHVQSLYNKEEKNGLSLKSIKNLHSVIHSSLEQAVKLELVDKNVSDACKITPPPKKEMHPIKDGDLVRFLGSIRESEYENILYFYTFTGVRRGEGVGLTWDCVDFKTGTIRIYRQWQKRPHLGDKSCFGFEPLKNNKFRTFKPAKQVMDMLKRVRVQQNQWKLACGDGWKAEHDFVFTHWDGTPYNADCVFKYFKKVVRELGLQTTRLHDLRHTFATLSLQNGTDVKTVSASLGHATTAFTMDQYGHVTEAMQRDSAERMEKLINSL